MNRTPTTTDGVFSSTSVVARGGVWPTNPFAFVFKCLKIRVRNLVSPLPVCCLCCCSNGHGNEFFRLIKEVY